MTTFDYLVPLEDLYQVPHPTRSGVFYSLGGIESPEHVERTYRVKVVLDHRDRPAVTFSDACKIRDARKAAAEEMRAAWLAEHRDLDRVAAWQRSRENFWHLNWLRVARQTGPETDGHGGGARHIALTTQRLSAEAAEAESAAGIPGDVQRQLTWPRTTLSWADPARSEDVSYHPPAEGDQ